MKFHDSVLLVLIFVRFLLSPGSQKKVLNFQFSVQFRGLLSSWPRWHTAPHHRTAPSPHSLHQTFSPAGAILRPAAHLQVSVVAEAEAGSISQGHDRVAAAASRCDDGRCEWAEQRRCDAAWHLCRLAEPELTAAVVAQRHQLALLTHLHGHGRWHM